jgi:hypothetical protein
VKLALSSAHNDSSDLQQMELPFTRVELDKTLTLAPNPKRVNGFWVTQTNSSNEAVEFMAEHFKRSPFFSGKRFRKSTYIPIISTVLANLLNAYNHRLQIIYSRDDHSGNRPWIHFWDFLSHLNLISTVIAGKNEKGVQSWCVALPELVELLKPATSTKIIFDRHQPSIEVRDKDKNVLPVSKNRAAIIKYNRLERDTRAFNEYWEYHTVTLDGKNVVPIVKRKFNDTLEMGGRFYGGFQQLSSKDRARLIIDDLGTAEMDYSSIHLAILYAWVGVQIKYKVAYTLEDYEWPTDMTEDECRKIIKLITLRALNIKNLSGLKTAITTSTKPKNLIKYKAYKDSRAIHDMRRAKGLASKAPFKAKWIDTFIEGIPSSTIANDLVAAFLEKHSAIKAYIGSPKLGVRLQAVDSEIMALVLHRLRLENIPALPVHDSVRIQKKHKIRARDVMAECFKEITGFKAQVREVLPK